MPLAYLLWKLIPKRGGIYLKMGDKAKSFKLLIINI